MNISIQHPKKQKFYCFLAHFMTVSFVGCQSWWGFPAANKHLKIIAHLILIYLPLSGILYVFLHFKEMPFETLGAILCLISMEIAVTIKLMTTYLSTYKQVMKNFMEQYHLFNYHDGNKYNKKILKKVERISQITAIAVFTATMLTGFSWSMVTLIYNIKNRDEITLNKTIHFQSPLYLVMPFDFLYDFKYMIFYYILNNIFILMYGCFIAAFDMIIYIIIYHLIGHIVILKNEIKTKFRQQVSENEKRTRIVEIIEHHNFIMKLLVHLEDISIIPFTAIISRFIVGKTITFMLAFKDVQSAYGLCVSGSYLNNLLTNSFFTYLIMFSETGNAVKYGLTLAVFFGGSVVTSLIFEEIRMQCYDLSETLYLVPWEDMSISNQKSIPIMLAQMQPPLIFVAAGGITAGIEPVVFIMKTTFSYYVMLKSVM